MKGKQIVAIDVGSSNVVIAVGAVEDDGRVDIRGIVSEPVQGVAAGHIDNSEQVGQAVVFLASEGAKVITGTTLYMDGGALLPVLTENPYV